MFTTLKLTDFKSFPSAELSFGPITAIIGANASGKSNVRDALKFLHGVGCGFTLPEIFDGKTGCWEGIRGGAPTTVRHGARLFKLQLVANELEYVIAINVTPNGALVAYECLQAPALKLYETYPLSQVDAKSIDVKVVIGGDVKQEERATFQTSKPILCQIEDAAAAEGWPAPTLVSQVSELRKLLSNIRFIDFAPSLMRKPSATGEKTISESGNNLSGVLRYLVLDQNKESVLASWIKALTPMDVSRIVFEEHPDDKTLAVLIESGGDKIPISCASDGTLRFLGILASVLSPEAPSLLCFEEIETGLHPVRVQLVSELLQKETADNKPQVLLTTHSPGLLTWLGETHRQHAYLSYRLPGAAETRLKAFRDIPTLDDALKNAEASRLFESGWFEDAVFFAEAKPTPISFVAEEPEQIP